jgi:4-cresol dehydrogenase (hydroxylating)
MRHLYTLGESIFHKFGFEYQITLSFLNGRASCAIMSISFDKTDTEETARALACSEMLVDRLMDEGYIPYRGSPAVLERVRQKTSDYWKKLSALKQSWDPQGILAPGRYIS